jgi:hypothetical protein
MATTTPNFGWPVPTSSDLVKNGATAIEGLGDAIDASLLDLKGGTTDQVLAKNSNTDMDFKWVSDATGMTNPMTTTGDVIYSSSGSTPARLGLGTAGQVLQVNTGATAPEWATPAGGLTYAAWTPSTTGITVGNGTLTARYAQSGKFVNGSFDFKLGSTSAITAAGISITAPVTLKASDSFQYSALLYDVSAEAVIGMVVTDTTTIYVGCAIASTSFAEYRSIGTSQPFTWTTNDRIIVNFSYEAA